MCKQLRLTDGLQQRVLLQFQPWVTLCEEACRAEFPHFDIFNSMLVFNLTGECLRETTQECQQCLRRLALALDVDAAALKHQWETLLPVATVQKKCGNLENREAWDQAFQQTQKNSYAQRQYKTDCLAPVLRAYACWSPSTHLGAIRGKGGRRRYFFKSVWHLSWSLFIQVGCRAGFLQSKSLSPRWSLWLCSRGFRKTIHALKLQEDQKLIWQIHFKTASFKTGLISRFISGLPALFLVWQTRNKSSQIVLPDLFQVWQPCFKSS